MVLLESPPSHPFVSSRLLHHFCTPVPCRLASTSLTSPRTVRACVPAALSLVRLRAACAAVSLRRLLGLTSPDRIFICRGRVETVARTALQFTARVETPSLSK
jgi:hypothetical protein